MFKSFLRDKLLLLLLIVAIFIKVFSFFPAWVERYYTFGFYQAMSQFLRIIFGWVPFSIGDLVYIFAGCFLVYKTWKLLKLLASRKLKTYLSWILFRKYVKLVLWIYIIFMAFWGLNYSRQGIAQQLQLDVKPYSTEDLSQLAYLLQQKLNGYAARVDSTSFISLNDNSTLFEKGIAAYQEAKKVYPFLAYEHPSVKASLYSKMGNYFGFTGYYNPFTGEAQLKTDVPAFVKPFIICHEIGHQIGYGKENEANFSGFLSGRVSTDTSFRYSVYYDAYNYAIGELLGRDVKKALALDSLVHIEVKKDRRRYRMYLLGTRNNIEPIMSNVYDRYLRLNNQPKGKGSYNEVVSWLVAYMKKYGAAAI